jgi:DNA-binding transcriptional LysR family regulator
MKMQSLSTLVAVVEQGSFAAAAERVNLTPSAVSLQMKQLEEYFRHPLFDRSGRNVRPTPFALELSRTVERAMSELEAMRNAADMAPTGTVRLGITESALTTLLPDAFAELQRTAPQIQLQIGRGITPELLNDVKAGRVDAAVLIRPHSGGSSRLRWTPLLDEDFVLVVPAGLPGRDVKALLRQSPWLRLDRETVAGQMAARFVDHLLPNRQPLIDVPAIEAIVAMIAAGIGVSVLPRLRPRTKAVYPVREISLGPGAPVRQIVMVRRGADAGMRRLDAVEQAFVTAAGG